MRITGLLVPLLLFVGLFCMAQPASNEKFVASWWEYDFGDIPLGEKASCILVIKNKFDHHLVIEQIITSCHCVSTDLKSARISPNESLVFTITLNSEGKRAGDTHQNLILCLSDGTFYSFVLRARLIEASD